MSRIEEILSYYNGVPAGVKRNLYTILMHGHLGGTGRIVVLPVDQGIEHGPAAAFAPTPNGYHPHSHFKRAIDLGLSAYAAPFGWLEAGSDVFAGQIPTILKLNNNNKLIESGSAPYPAWTASVHDALRLGCSAIGMTIYPGSDASNTIIQEAAEVIAEASSVGLPSVVWSYPRGAMGQADETALDVVAYGAHIAATIGAHIIKVKLPSAHIAHNQSLYQNIPTQTLTDRVKHVVQCAFDGQRIITFSGGDKKDDVGVLDDVRAIIQGGGFGSMMGRNIFQRPIESAKDLAQKIIDLYSI